MKQKTRKEVKEEKKLWRNVGCLALAIFIMFFVYFINNNMELKEEVTICQCNMWTYLYIQNQCILPEINATETCQNIYFEGGKVCEGLE